MLSSFDMQEAYPGLVSGTLLLVEYSCDLRAYLCSSDMKICSIFFFNLFVNIFRCCTNKDT